jgi:thioredoxin-dependent peroxiredoxin
MSLPIPSSLAPKLCLPNQDGTVIDLAALGTPAIVYFYPKDSTPGCTTEACDFRDSMARLAGKAVVLGISRDSAKSHQKFREKLGLDFDLLVDESTATCEAWGVWQMKKFMGREGMGIVRSTFLIDAQGKVAKVWSPVKVKGHVDEVLEALAGLN